MLKCDVTVSKKFTFNTGNYSSISPQMSITLKDVNIDRIPEIHKKLDVIADGMFHNQIRSDIETMATVKKMGFDKYFREVDMEIIDDEVKKLVKDITEEGGF